jgi:hypothetical protein
MGKVAFFSSLRRWPEELMSRLLYLGARFESFIENAAIHLAAEANCTDLVAQLLDPCATINASNRCMETALLVAEKTPV